MKKIKKPENLKGVYTGNFIETKIMNKSKNLCYVDLFGLFFVFFHSISKINKE